MSTPASEGNRRLSDPMPRWDGPSPGLSTGRWNPHEQLPQLSFGDGDGPPFSEDDDLASPVITSAKHRKQKSNMVGFDQMRGRTRDVEEGRRGYVSTNGDGSQTYYEGNLGEAADDQGGEYVTNPTGSDVQAGGSNSRVSADDHDRRDSHFQTTLPRASYTVPIIESDDFELVGDNDPDDDDAEESRYSRDYQFTIASPDEEMHGKAIALFDFEKENENELPLKEGQVILVSYRHGEGWLVAEDPLTNESGLVPEEFVRLLREIEGGLDGLIDENGEGSAEESCGENVEGNDEGNDEGDDEGNVEETAEGSTTAPVEKSAEAEEQCDPDGGIPLTAAERRELGGRSSPEEAARTPTQPEHSKYSGTFYPPVVSHFHTSRKELFGGFKKDDFEDSGESSDGIMIKTKERKGSKSS